MREEPARTGPYTLRLRSDAGHGRPAERPSLLTQLRRIPGVEELGPDLYGFGEPDDHGRMEIEFRVFREGQSEPVDATEVTDAEAPLCHEIEIRVPRPWVLERGPRVFALVFMLAEWARWEVFDPQIDDTLQKEAVLSGLVAMRQAQRDAEARGAGSHSTSAAFPPGGDPYEPRTKTPPPAPKKRRPWWKLR